MPEDVGRNHLIGVRVTARERDAIQRRVGDLRAEGDTEVTKSSLAHHFMQNGGLKELVAFYFGGPEDTNPQNRGVS